MKRLWDSPKEHCGNDRDEIVGCSRIAQGKAQLRALRTNYPSNSMEHSPSKSNSSSTAEDISQHFRNQKFHPLVHSSPPLGPFLSYVNQVHSLPPNFFTIHFNIPSTTVFSEWSLSFRFYYQNLVRLSPYTCHMTRLSHPQIMLCAWVITLLLGKVAEDSGLVVCGTMSSGCSWYFKDREVLSKRYIPQDTSSAALLLQEIADASFNV